jgi:hypothetical protein
MKRNFLSLTWIVLFTLLLTTTCEKEDPNKASLLTGLWVQERITEDGVEIPLPNEEKSLSLLIEPNGVYRTYAKDAAQKELFGAWTVTDNTWLELSTDIWRIVANPVEQSAANQWQKNHILIRFTILEISGNRLEIRLQTYIGNKKYSALFVEGVRPLITEENLEEIDGEFKILKTYIYTFVKK